MYITIKNIDRLQTESLEKLQNTPLKDAGPGSIVRLLLAVINSELAECYSQLKTSHLGGFVSTAEGEFLDLLGDIVHCSRYPGEPDEEYRYRITSQELVDAAANKTALRLAALSVDGVRDVVMREYAGGAGSLSLYVVMDNPEQRERILNEVRASIEEVRGTGVRVEILTPDLVRIGAELGAVLRGGIPEYEQSELLFVLTQAASDYVNSLRPGDSLTIGGLTERVLSASTFNDNGERHILEVKVLKLYRNDQEVMVEDQHCRWNERFIEDGVRGIKVI